MDVNNLSHELLLSLVSYDKETGLFRWKVKRQGAKSCTFGHADRKGYRKATVAGKQYMVHRLAWLYVHGEMPSGQIDHINGIKNDNRIANLRIVDNFGNAQNRRTFSRNNVSGFLGVHKCGGKWRAQIRINKKLIHLGLFDTPEKAHESYVSAKRVIHATCSI